VGRATYQIQLVLVSSSVVEVVETMCKEEILKRRRTRRAYKSVRKCLRVDE
jgi:phage-related holin